MAHYYSVQPSQSASRLQSR